MEQILSQEEIDALLKGISEGEIETEVQKAPEVEEKVKPFDILKVKIKRERLPALDFVYDRFAKSLRASLSLFLERELEIEITEKEFVEYGEFIKTLPLPTNMNIITTEHLNGFFILIFDAKLVFTILEIVLGGAQIRGSKVEGREFTRIEMSIMKRVIELILSELEKAWAPVFEIRCRYSRSEINPNYVTMISPEESVHLATFTVEIDEIRGWFKICFPYGILDTIKEYLISTPAREDLEVRNKWFSQLKRNLMDVPLEVRAVLGKRIVSLSEFLKLKERDLFFLDKHVNDDVDVYVANKRLFTGKVGTYKGGVAIRIQKAMKG